MVLALISFEAHTILLPPEDLVDVDPSDPLSKLPSLHDCLFLGLISLLSETAAIQ